MTKIVLCADDSATMQRVAEITFRASGYQYVGAQSADEALQRARAQKPALILADAIMPGKTGYELCREIKSDPSLADVPVMVLCGKSQAYDPAKGSEVGADAHITKPWDSQVMLDKVNEVLSQGASASPSAGQPVAAPPANTVPASPPIATPPPPAFGTPGAPGGIGEPPRQPTIMGMPSLKTPGIATPAPRPMPPAAQRPQPPSNVPRKPLIGGNTPPRAPSQAGAPPARRAPMIGGAKPPAGRAPTPMPRPATSQPAPRPATSQPTPMARPATSQPAPTPRPATSQPAPVARPATSQPAPASPRPMTAPPAAPPTNMAGAVQAAVPSAAAKVAQEAGLDPAGPEMQALVKLSREVVERVVWEVVPQLAEAIIKENLGELTKNR